MHIPDGYLSPETTLPVFGIMFGIWYLAFKKIKAINQQQLIPNIALCASFAFVIMMFNIPVAGGSSAHAVGAVLVAILVGPWAACLAISTTLTIQALMFGDGGILALGVNCLNMAVIMPFSGYIIYKIISGQVQLGCKRNLIAIFIGAYCGINLAALAVGIEMGIQPILFKTISGAPLYGFYPLSVTIPAMMITHLFFAGPLDGLISVVAFNYVVKFAPQLVIGSSAASNSVISDLTFWQKNKKILILLCGLILLTPLGLLTSQTAFGEWSHDEVRQLIGYIPSGMAKSSNWWNALLPDYTLRIFGSSHVALSLGYIVSAIIGVILVMLLIIISARTTKSANRKS